MIGQELAARPPIMSTPNFRPRKILTDFTCFVNGKMACSSGVGAPETSDGSVVLSDSAKAELLNDYFVSTGVLDNVVVPFVQP